MQILRMACVLMLVSSCATTPRNRIEPGNIAADDGSVLFASTRDDPQGDLFGSEIYRMDGDGKNPTRLTDTEHASFFASLSPDGRTILFESNRLRSGDEPRNISDLFLMDRDGGNPRHLVRGASGTWSPDGRSIAYHASASGKGMPISIYPGAASSDSDLFVISLDSVGRASAPRNITNDPSSIDDDPDWSPDGASIVFASHPLQDAPTDAVNAEIYVVDPRSSGALKKRLTENHEEERAPSWSPDGSRIVYCCKGGGTDFEICAMNADGSNQIQLTNNEVADLTATWSPDGKRIAFHRAVSGRASLQLMIMNADGTEQTQWTLPPGQNAFPNWSPSRTR